MSSCITIRLVYGNCRIPRFLSSVPPRGAQRGELECARSAVWRGIEGCRTQIMASTGLSMGLVRGETEDGECRRRSIEASTEPNQSLNLNKFQLQRYGNPHRPAIATSIPLDSRPVSPPLIHSPTRIRAAGSLMTKNDRCPVTNDQCPMTNDQ